MFLFSVALADLFVGAFGIVQRICTIYQYNYAKNGKGLKVGKKEADAISINNRVGGTSKD